MLGRETVLPRRGSSVLTIPGVSGLALAGATTGALVEYRWPAPFKLAGMLAFPMTKGAISFALAASSLFLRILDSDGDSLAFDSDGTLTDSYEVTAHALAGGGPPLAMGTELLDPANGQPYMPRWFALERTVRAGEVWRFQARNASAVSITPFLGFRLEELTR